MKKPTRTVCFPLLLALTFTVGITPAGAESGEEPPPWPPEDTNGKYVPVHPDYYKPVEDIPACGGSITVESGDVREVEEWVTVRRDGRTVTKYRGNGTVDILDASGEVLIDELDVSGPGTVRISADQKNLNVALKGASIVYPSGPVEAAAFAAAGLPEVFFFEKGRLVIEVEFLNGPDAEPTSIDIAKDNIRHVRDICDMIDEAAGQPAY